MKKLALVFTLIVSFTGFSQTKAFTDRGKEVLLFADGTWKYSDTPFTSRREKHATCETEFDKVFKTKPLDELYKESFDYAHEIIYGNVFFDSERNEKASRWATDNFMKDQRFEIGKRNLESWYDEFYNLAYNQINKHVFFDKDRVQYSIDYAIKILKTRSYYSPLYFYNDTIGRTRDAYSLAYNKIYANVFWEKDRKQLSATWSMSFVQKTK
ncbi:MAG: hypothetical protein KA313_04090 [Pseudarcicella sp.]|jgi:hypothetical protein|nr:hypothetical protein [Pseudarcicella sp.]MBP6410257.1 hypothetical protein [Pseudarcicella sp.]